MRAAVKMPGVCLGAIVFMCPSILTACAETEEAQIRQVVERYVEALPGECFMYERWPRSFNRFDTKRLIFLSKIGLAEFEKISSYRYDGRLTDKGQRYYFPNTKSPNMFGGIGALCAGQHEFLQIEEYTTPSEMLGMIVTTVRYRYRLIDVPNWIKTQEALELFPVSAPRLKTTTIINNLQLVKTNKGWRVIR